MADRWSELPAVQLQAAIDRSMEVAMAASSLGLNPEALFSSAYADSYSYSSSPFLADHAPLSFPAGGELSADQDNYALEFEFEYSPPVPPILSGDGDGDGGGKRATAARGNGRIGFRTRSEVEVMDDGFKWRKYGKKAVKNSPNPRNYYRCSSAGCGVKKRVERDRDDHRYVVTTYDGVHNHATPADGAALYYCSAAVSCSPPAAAYPAAGSPLQF